MMLGARLLAMTFCKGGMLSAITGSCPLPPALALFLSAQLCAEIICSYTVPICAIFSRLALVGVV